MKKAGIAIAIIFILLLGILGGGYYKLRYAPAKIASDFLRDLEFKGVDFYSLRKYMFSDFDIKPLMSWEDFYSKKKDNYSSQEACLEMWQASTALRWELTGILDYIDVYVLQDDLFGTPDNIAVFILSNENFLDVYKPLAFQDFEIGVREYSSDTIEVFGTVNITYIGSAPRSLGNSILGGTRKFSLKAKHGDVGWKITSFVVRYSDSIS